MDHIWRLTARSEVEVLGRIDHPIVVEVASAAREPILRVSWRRDSIGIANHFTHDVINAQARFLVASIWEGGRG